VKGRNPEHVAAFKELSDFLTAEVAVRRANPTDDLITHLAEAEIDGDRLSEREIVLTTATFVMAGVESLSSFMSMFALNLHDLRFNTSAQRFKRVVMRETTVHGQRMRVGDKVALAFGSGNRDRRKFPDPDVYDVDRRPQGHLGFGMGKHFCLGSQMARLVTAVAMKRFLARVPDYQLAAGEVAWNSSSNFRSPIALQFVMH
jgi:cytochrome P450